MSTPQHRPAMATDDLEQKCAGLKLAWEQWRDQQSPIDPHWSTEHDKRQDARIRALEDAMFQVIGLLEERNRTSNSAQS